MKEGVRDLPLGTPLCIVVSSESDVAAFADYVDAGMSVFASWIVYAIVHATFFADVSSQILLTIMNLNILKKESLPYSSFFILFVYLDIGIFR